MVSKIILDSPKILEESLVNLTEATKCFPFKVSRASLERWVRRGSRGVRLETAYVCGKRFTSLEAIDRFIRDQLLIEPEFARPESKRGTLSKKEITEAKRKHKLPDPDPQC